MGRGQNTNEASADALLFGPRKSGERPEKPSREDYTHLEEPSSDNYFLPKLERRSGKGLPQSSFPKQQRLKRGCYLHKKLHRDGAWLRYSISEWSDDSPYPLLTAEAFVTAPTGEAAYFAVKRSELAPDKADISMRKTEAFDPDAEWWEDPYYKKSHEEHDPRALRGIDYNNWSNCTTDDDKKGNPACDLRQHYTDYGHEYARYRQMQ